MRDVFVYGDTLRSWFSFVSCLLVIAIITSNDLLFCSKTIFFESTAFSPMWGLGNSDMLGCLNKQFGVSSHLSCPWVKKSSIFPLTCKILD